MLYQCVELLEQPNGCAPQGVSKGNSRPDVCGHEARTEGKITNSKVNTCGKD